VLSGLLGCDGDSARVCAMTEAAGNAAGGGPAAAAAAACGGALHVLDAGCGACCAELAFEHAESEFGTTHAETLQHLAAPLRLQLLMVHKMRSHKMTSTELTAADLLHPCISQNTHSYRRGLLLGAPAAAPARARAQHVCLRTRCVKAGGAAGGGAAQGGRLCRRQLLPAALRKPGTTCPCLTDHALGPACESGTRRATACLREC
jgi:hypothetical protein